MPCYHPLKAFQLEDGSVVFAERHGHGSVRDLDLPCGQCIGCRLERSRQWAVRCMHEASLNDCNLFVTLTYSDEHLPGASLRYRDFQLFMKRLRKARPGTPIRFFMSGEYGETTFRPHYHALLFNCWFSDRVQFGVGAGGAQQWISAELDELWGLGNCVIGSVTFQSAGYVARYCLEKVNGEQAKAYYRRLDPVTLQMVDVVPEFMHCSQGIGKAYLAKHWDSIFNNASPGRVVQNGRLQKAPRYYDKKLEAVDSDKLASIKFDRYQHALQNKDDSPERLAVREEVLERRAGLLIRNLK